MTPDDIATIDAALPREGWENRDTGASVSDRAAQAETPPSSFNIAETDAWPPPLDNAAYHGIAGDIVHAIEPSTEADPVALLLQLLVFFGNAVGRSPHFTVEGDRHGLNQYVVLVGETSKARKGTSLGRIKAPFALAAPEWLAGCMKSGLSTGEGLIWEVHDDVWGYDKDGNSVLKFPAVEDKRRLVVEPEFGSVLRRMEREGNTLSSVLRDAWDGVKLDTMVKTPQKSVSTDHHISILGHITRDELVRYLSRTEAANGFGNRFTWACVRRARLLPLGAAAPELEPHLFKLRRGLRYGLEADRITMHAEAVHVWTAVYGGLSEGRPGLLGSMLGRAEAHVRRWSAIYAVLDSSEVVTAQHMLAALALWDYCEASTRYVFGTALGDPDADEVLRAVRQAGDAGMTTTDLHAYFSRHMAGGVMRRSLTTLAEKSLIRVVREATGGRPAERYFAALAPTGGAGGHLARGRRALGEKRGTGSEISEKGEQRSGATTAPALDPGLSSPNPLISQESPHERAPSRAYLRRYPRGWHLVGENGTEVCNDRGEGLGPFSTEAAARAWATAHHLEVIT